MPAGITLDIEGGTTLKTPTVTGTVNAGRINLSGNGAELKVLPNDPGHQLDQQADQKNTGTIGFASRGPSDGLRLDHRQRPQPGDDPGRPPGGELPVPRRNEHASEADQPGDDHGLGRQRDARDPVP